MNDIKLPSNRSFGSLFIFVFFVAAIWSFYQHNGYGWYWLVLIGCVGFVTVVVPDWLAPFNRAWMMLGQMLNRIVSPIVLSVMYFGVVVPIGLIMKAMGRDPMTRGFDSKIPTYWVERKDGNASSESLKDQF